MGNATCIATALLLFGTIGMSSELPPDQARILEQVRTSALAYSQRLPDFICTQVTHRETSTTAGWAGTVRAGGSTSVIEERLTFIGQKENYQVVAVDGRKADGLDRTEFYGAMSAGEFGSTLEEIFNPQSETSFSWIKMMKINGRDAYLFGFQVPAANGATVTHRETSQQIVVGFKGEIAVDAEKLEVLRINSVLELPKSFPIQASELTVQYQPVEIAGRPYMLPVHSEVRVRDTAHLFVNKIDFKNYRKFAVESTIHYNDETPQ
jgi:hypothetical protein